MKNNTQLLAIAKKQIGNGGAKYRNYVGAGGSWCDMFVYWLFNANGCGSLLPWKGQQRTYCPASIKWCSNNLAQIPMYLAMPCDIIYFDWDKNGNPNHIGIVEKRRDTSSVYTIEGNTSGGKVDDKIRTGYIQAIYRPHFVPSKVKKCKLDETDYNFGYVTIYNLQLALKLKADGVLGKSTVKALQKWAGASQDGAWGNGTSKAIQKKLGFKGKAVDGAFGKQSIIALKKWINKTNGYTNKKPSETKPAAPAAPAKPAAKPKATLKSRRIEVDLTNQICTVYGIYSDGTTKPIMSEFVSTARKGKTTPVGNFKIQGASGGRKAKLRTAKLSGGKTYAEFLVRFHGGKCMHTVPYKSRNTSGKVYKGQFNKLGTVASAGCVRMPWILAHYIYTYCPIGTPVKVFKGTKGKYPAGKPKKYTATSDLDPTYKK